MELLLSPFLTQSLSDLDWLLVNFCTIGLVATTFTIVCIARSNP